MQQLHPVVLRLFQKKGFTHSMIEDFLSWDLKTIPDMGSLKDLGKASARIIEAIDKEEKIGIYGDYDVDGTTSCALLYHFFHMLGVNVSTVQPSRFVEGYGLHLSSIDEAVANNLKILITVDCGITNNEAADYAREKGLDLIITDHHKDARETMPNAFAVINPNRRDEIDNPHYDQLKTMAGVTVAFALAVQIRNDLIKMNQKIPSIYSLLQFVAIGTICDLAHLSPLNLKLVRHGLKLLKDTEYPGLRAFFTSEELKAKSIPSEKLAFHVGPLINSKGRLEHPEASLQLLISDNAEKAREYYDLLVSCNAERKFIQSEVYNEAREQVVRELKHHDGEHLITIVYQPHWHEGVIGIVASKLVEAFKVPAIVFTDSEHEGIIKASCRSAGDLDIFSLLKKESELFIKFGGHKAAAGLSMPKENLRAFIDNMNASLKNIPAITRTRIDFYDLDIDATEINPQLMRDLDLLEPFGMGNEKPKFRIKGVKLDSFDLMKDVHVRWSLSKEKVKLKGISFNYIGKHEAITPSEVYSTQNLKQEDLSVYFTLGLNRFNGNESIQLMVDKLEFS
ncbi:single-stranded-DNA-specific exonuclease RecJ [Bacteriovorax stolpii]|uniref:Single-stranded-DNA-specific exonuclease RecJ n=1 Tax=Bacteriovorax stolpii TaxID=960 RepID=A0A2K9NNS9_BACTC|nr:single-stranded-DNA-specific exonuclease RecJ [Bacteriovorax stolpii]AUN97148.1 single-stranded-DNA-specific exonuclease RecJ [Bacteriovorax stolpii]TDP53434.1 single-stranded-DNA-specific exonuclease [Bacteriovorax stolpii]